MNLLYYNRVTDRRQPLGLFQMNNNKFQLVYVGINDVAIKNQIQLYIIIHKVSTSYNLSLIEPIVGPLSDFCHLPLRR